MALESKITSTDMLQAAVAYNPRQANYLAAELDYYDSDSWADEWWKVREKMRFAFNVYKPIPIEVKREINRHIDSSSDNLFGTATANMYVHASVDEPGMVAFTPDVKHGESDRQVRTKIGRFLRRLDLGLTEPAIAKISALLRSELAPVEVFFAESEEDISMVYNEGPRSCMCGEGREFDAEIAPERVYAGPDTMVAYTRRNGRINSRAVVRRDDQTWVRSYGDECLIEEGLTELGYTRGNSLDGARLSMPKFDDEYVMPYLDGDAVEVSEYTDEKGTWWKVSEEGYWSAQSLYGFLDEEARRGEYCDWHHDTTTDMVEYVRSVDQRVCTDCLNYDFIEAYHRHGHGYVCADQTLYAWEGDTYTADALAPNDLVKMPNGNIQHNDDVYEDDISGDMIVSDDATLYMDQSGDECYTVCESKLVYSHEYGHHILADQAYELSTGDHVFDTDQDLIDQDNDQLRMVL